MGRREQERLDRLIENGQQAEYEAELDRKRSSRRHIGASERESARRREEALEHLLDQMDLD